MKANFSLGRRDVLRAAVAATLVGSLPRLASAQSPLTRLSAAQAIARMKSGDLRAEDYATALLDRCESLGRINAFISLDRERTLEAARDADRRRTRGEALGVLHGLPVPVKDSICARGFPATSGTAALKDFRPRDDAAAVARLREAGALVLGKTNLHEMSYGWTSNNFAFGPVANPYELRRIAGGSTGGSAAAVAAGMAPLGIGGDTGGSVRVPAALCGICGFRPSVGRYPSRGAIGITPLMDTLGPLARNVEDIALFDAALAGERIAPASEGLRGVRLGVPRGLFWEDLEPGVERVARQALARLREAGATLVEADIADVATLTPAAFFPIVLHETESTVTAALQEIGAGITMQDLVRGSSPWLQYVFAEYIAPGGKSRPPVEAYRSALEKALPALKAGYLECFRSHGVQAVVFPAVPVTAPMIGEDVEITLNGRKVPTYLALGRNVRPGSVSGSPGLVLPAGLDDRGLPVGMEFDAPSGADRALIGLGFALEKALGPIAAPTV